ncbi:hypothetical protein F4781DRAFT_437714 [Annulohypoxylon bovei var. microspora]|nr:hypothetical protein F4781DRAFT_437714 [Annulohypoxylon bovei var. microspora]
MSKATSVALSAEASEGILDPYFEEMDRPRISSSQKQARLTCPNQDCVLRRRSIRRRIRQENFRVAHYGMVQQSRGYGSYDDLYPVRCGFPVEQPPEGNGDRFPPYKLDTCDPRSVERVTKNDGDFGRPLFGPARDTAHIVSHDRGYDFPKTSSDVFKLEMAYG